MVQDIHNHYSLNDFHRFNQIGNFQHLLHDNEFIPDCSNLEPERSSQQSFVTLRNGIQMPLLGLGTTHSGGYNHESVVFALKKCGYRMIDTAKRYGVEEKIGKAIKESKVPREQLFVNTKLWPTDFGSNVSSAYRAACNRLQLEYLDSYMIHVPVVPEQMGDKELLLETWRELEKLYDADKVKSIGVSNFTIQDLEFLMDNCVIPPHLNQCEFHPCHNPLDLRRFCAENGITFSGYCPLAKGRILNLDVIQKIAQKHNKTPAQVCIKWSIQQKVCAIPKSRKPSRVLENSIVFNFEIDSDDMDRLNNLHLNDTRKVVKFDNIQECMHLPDGYKLV